MGFTAVVTGFSTWALYSEYMGFVLGVHECCTRRTWALYCWLKVG